MRHLFIYLFLVCCIATGQAQEITELEETWVTFAPTEKITSNLNGHSYTVVEKYAAEFAEDPIKYMNGNFDIDEFIRYNKKKNYDSYLVIFSSSQGYLETEFDKNGKLVKNKQSFRDIFLPQEIREALYRDHKGWSMVKNKYYASGKNKNIDKAYYKIKLKNGNKSQRIRIEPDLSEQYDLADN